jgi:alpha-tubulin suppressor-like RCC1 family protein
LLLQAAFITAAAVPLSGCGSTAAPQETPEDQVADVQLSVTLPVEGQSIGRRSLSSLSTETDREALLSISDVSKIMVDITQINVPASSNRVIFKNTELTRNAADGIWSATLPFLPRNVVLEFRGTATSANGTTIFSGTTLQTLTASNSRVTIAMAPADNNHTLAIPRISRISVPTQLSSGGSGSISVEVQGSSGEVLSFTMAPASNGGEIFPVTGQITLSGTSATLVFQYTAPVLSADQTFEHSITVHNPRGTSVRSNFSTSVLQAGQTAGVNGSELRVQFSPIINNLIARRIPNTTDIEWSAEVTDDRPTNPDLLTYSWQFLNPVGVTTPPAFTVNARTTIMSDYDPAVSGTIRLAVTDADNGTTTLNWTLPTNQFLNQSDLIIEVGTGGGVASVVAGGSHTCARIATGGIRCWGKGNEGQRGYSNPDDSGKTPATLPSAAGSIPELERARQVVAGTAHTCALFDNGQVACWGRGAEGQLGYNSPFNVGDNESVASYGYVNLGGNVTRIAAGGNHTCALLDTGNVRCWGQNNRGQLGYGNSATRPRVGDDEAPYVLGDVPLGGALVADVTAGLEHTCVLLRDGNVRCWGRGSEGQLGYGNSQDQGVSQIPPATNLNFNGARIRQLVAGGYHTCAMFDNGSVTCWGKASSGQLGVSSVYNANPSLSNNWGDSANETPHEMARQNPLDLGGGRKALAVTAGTEYTCALLDTGAVRCWGANANGELGQGNTTLRPTPTTAGAIDVSLGASVVRLTSGANHNCALLTSGQVRCWGKGADGQLGYGNTNNVGHNGQVDGAGFVSVL